MNRYQTRRKSELVGGVWAGALALLCGLALVAGPAMAQEPTPAKAEPTQPEKPQAPAAGDEQTAAPKADQPRPAKRVVPKAGQPGTKQIATPGRPGARPSRAVVKGGAAPVIKTPTGQVTGAPGLRVPEPVFNFGEVWTGGVLKHAYVIRNEGDQALKILSVKPSCGCTVAGTYDKDIPPGGEGKIPVSLSSKKIHGKFSKSILVTCNDPATPALRMTISGTVKQYVKLEPPRVNFSHIRDGGERTQVVKVTNNTEQELKLSVKGSATSGAFSAEIVEKEPGKTYEVTVLAKPPYQPKLNNASITFLTGVKEQAELKLPVSAYVPPRLDVRPDNLVMASAPASDLTRPVRFTNNGTKPVKVLSAEIDDEKVKVAVTERQEGKQYDINVTFPAGYVAPNTGRTLVLKTDDAEQPEIKIPVKARPKRKQRTRPAEKLLGKKSPEAKFTTVAGKPLATGEASGQVTVLDFYASWCGFCKRQIPTVNELYERKYADNPDVRFVAVSADQLKSAGATGKRAKTDAEITATFKKTGATFERTLDPDGQVKSKFLVGSFPTLMVLGKNGTVEAVHFGAKPDLPTMLEKEIDLLLAGKTRADFPHAKAQAKASPTDRGAISGIQVKQASTVAQVPAAAPRTAGSKAAGQSGAKPA
ncbi:MAG: DUF1573 domain-containing protein, partial [bacterium]|nr:DUF1573 domain-containing protein [bacterium]